MRRRTERLEYYIPSPLPWREIVYLLLQISGKVIGLKLSRSFPLLLLAAAGRLLIFSKSATGLPNITEHLFSVVSCPDPISQNVLQPSPFEFDVKQSIW